MDRENLSSFREISQDELRRGIGELAVHSEDSHDYQDMLQHVILTNVEGLWGKEISLSRAFSPDGCTNILYEDLGDYIGQINLRDKTYTLTNRFGTKEVRDSLKTALESMGLDKVSVKKPVYRQQRRRKN